MKHLKLYIKLTKAVVFALCLAMSLFVHGQPEDNMVTSWSYGSTGSEHIMSFGISESTIDMITLEDSTFPIGGVIGVFYENNASDLACVGSVIWDGQSTVIPVWGGDSGLVDGQEIFLYALVNGVTYSADTSYLYTAFSHINITSLNFIYQYSSDVIVGCMDPSACNYDFYATVAANDGCVYPIDLYPSLNIDGVSYVNCDGSCESDYDADGVCDIIEIYGCMDEQAYNYSSIAT